MGDNINTTIELQKRIQASLMRLASTERILAETVYASEGSSSMSETLKIIGEQKSNLFIYLQKLYAVRKDMAEGSAASLVSIRGLKLSIEQQLEATEKLIKKLQDKLHSKKRMTEIADYQYNKYLSYKRILKLFVYISIVSIVLVMLIRQPWFPKIAGKGLLMVLGAYLIYNVGSILLVNFRRDDKYWNKFRQFSAKDFDVENQGYPTLSRWEHNKRAFNKLFDGLGGAEGICAAAINKAKQGGSDFVNSASV